MNSRIAGIISRFRGQPRSIGSHLSNDWDPHMRKPIIEHYQAAGADLRELARHAQHFLAADTNTGEGSHARVLLEHFGALLFEETHR